MAVQWLSTLARDVEMWRLAIASLPDSFVLDRARKAHASCRQVAGPVVPGFGTWTKLRCPSPVCSQVAKTIAVQEINQ